MSEMEFIRTRDDLIRFTKEFNLDDWHEPDQNGISAHVYGDHLDNAMGPGHIRNYEPEQSKQAAWYPALRKWNYAKDRGIELNVVLTSDEEPIAVVNLADLFRWASEGEQNESRVD